MAEKIEMIQPKLAGRAIMLHPKLAKEQISRQIRLINWMTNKAFSDGNLISSFYKFPWSVEGVLLENDAINAKLFCANRKYSITANGSGEFVLARDEQIMPQELQAKPYAKFKVVRWNGMFIPEKGIIESACFCAGGQILMLSIYNAE